MIDVDKHVARWHASGEEDRTVAEDLVRRGHYRHGLFFAHLALEKILKAIVCQRTADIPPRTHNLVRLAELAGLEPSADHLDALAELNAFNIEGRYPDSLAPPPNPREADRAVRRSAEVFEWLKKRL